jgi:hypothetical protein
LLSFSSLTGQAREAKKKAKQKEEEKEKWWRGAELFRSMDPSQMVEEEDEDGNKQVYDTELAKKQAIVQRYSNDYSRWEQPVVDDPATQAEEAEKAAKKEAIEVVFI